MVVTSSELEDPIAQAVEHRRNFAIISHPDAGKTTLTEKLLLYGGAIQGVAELQYESLWDGNILKFEVVDQ